MSKAFLQIVKETCKQYGVKFYFSKYNTVNANGFRSGGGFGVIPEPALSICGKNLHSDNWITVLIHESCHLDQWKDNARVWRKYSKKADLHDKWLSGEAEYSDKQIDSIIQGVVKLELDCEKRSIKKIEKYGIKWPVKKYIQQCNCYLYFYLYTKETRRWMNLDKKGYSPISNSKVYGLCPSKFLKSYKTIPPKVYEAFKKYNV